MRVDLLLRLRTFVLFSRCVCVCDVASLRCFVVFFWCFVTDVHGIGPTCLLLLLCVCVRACFEREGERDRESMRGRGRCRDGWGSYQLGRYPVGQVVGLVESSQFDELSFDAESKPVESRFEVEVRLAGQRKRQSA